MLYVVLCHIVASHVQTHVQWAFPGCVVTCGNYDNLSDTQLNPRLMRVLENVVTVVRYFRKTYVEKTGFVRSVELSIVCLIRHSNKLRFFQYIFPGFMLPRYHKRHQSHVRRGFHGLSTSDHTLPQKTFVHDGTRCGRGFQCVRAPVTTQKRCG